MKTRHHLIIDLAPVADKLLWILCKHISNTEYQKIYSTVNPSFKMNLLLDAIYVRNDTEIYVQFCDAVKIVGCKNLSQELRNLLD